MHLSLFCPRGGAVERKYFNLSFLSILVYVGGLFSLYTARPSFE